MKRIVKRREENKGEDKDDHIRQEGEEDGRVYVRSRMIGSGR